MATLLPRVQYADANSNRVNSDLIVWEAMAVTEIFSFGIIAHLEHDSIGFLAIFIIFVCSW